MRNLAHSDFAEAFRTHSVPRIRQVIEIRAHFVGLGLYPFSGACVDAVSYAGRLGAYVLPPAHFDALTDWIAARIADAAAEVEARCGR